MSDPSTEVFTKPWAELFRDQINQSADYRRHGAAWEAPVTLEMSFRGSAEPRTVVLDLHRGTCEKARCGGASEAGLVIRSDVPGWRKILAGRMDPIWGIMSGKLKLMRGSLSELVPYALAAKALVDSAAKIDASFPPEEGP